MLFDKPSIAIGSADPNKARILLRQDEQAIDVPANGLGIPTLAGDNVFTGTNEFDGATNFDGAVDFDAAVTHDAVVDFNAAITIDAGATMSGFLVIPSAGTLTIASGSITITASRHLVDTQGGAATDDLDNITGSTTDGTIVILSTVSGARDVTVRHNAGGTGNIRLAGAANQTMGGPSSPITFMYNSSASTWMQIGSGV